MKTVLLSLVLTFFSTLVINAQEHIMFMGIPIDGNLQEFSSKLTTKGFEKKHETDNNIIFSGKFTGEDVTLAVLSTYKSHKVFQIMIFFNKETSWSNLKQQFNHYKDIYSQKYGAPSKESHYFIKPYYEGDGYEMQALSLDKCNYATLWNIENGDIAIMMGKDGSIVIVYSDKINETINDKEKNENDINDI